MGSPDATYRRDPDRLGLAYLDSSLQLAIDPVLGLQRIDAFHEIPVLLNGHDLNSARESDIIELLKALGGPLLRIDATIISPTLELQVTTDDMEERLVNLLPPGYFAIVLPQLRASDVRAI